MNVSQQSASTDLLVERVMDHLGAAHVGLLTAADSQVDNAGLLEAQAFVSHAISVLCRVGVRESVADSKADAIRVTLPEIARLL
jgi:hypothetical protein